jgi:2'-5' RNA ligase
MNLRLFIALELPPVFLQDLAGDLEDLRKAHPDYRWTNRENQHLTLAFLGAVPEENIPILLEALERTMNRWQRTTTTKIGIPVSAHGIYTFPPRKPASVLAVGLKEGKEEVSNLASILEQELLSVKTEAQLTEFEAARRPFTPHITVARAGKSPIHLEATERNLQFTARGTITYVTLFSSILQRGGPVYTVQGRFHV